MTIGIRKQTQFLNERIKHCKETGFVILTLRKIVSQNYKNPLKQERYFSSYI